MAQSGIALMLAGDSEFDNDNSKFGRSWSTPLEILCKTNFLVFISSTVLACWFHSPAVLRRSFTNVISVISIDT